MLNIIEKDNKKLALLTLKGDPLGESDAEMVRQRIRSVVESKIHHVVFEMSGVHHINSAGLGGLVMANVTMVRAGGTIQLAGICENVDRVLRITRLDTVFDIVSSAEEAIKKWKGEE
jgi:anti-sigma B factor antagonist